MSRKTKERVSIKESLLQVSSRLSKLARDNDVLMMGLKSGQTAVKYLIADRDEAVDAIEAVATTKCYIGDDNVCALFHTEDPTLQVLLKLLVKHGRMVPSKRKPGCFELVKKGER